MCIVFLSEFTLLDKSTHSSGKNRVVRRMMTCKFASHHQKKQNGECSQQGCSLMFACSINGFLKVDPLSVKALLISYIKKSVPPHKIGNLSGYHPTDWKPPKVC
jgi:hypothetical protein